VKAVFKNQLVFFADVLVGIQCAHPTQNQSDFTVPQDGYRSIQYLKRSKQVTSKVVIDLPPEQYGISRGYNKDQPGDRLDETSSKNG